MSEHALNTWNNENWVIDQLALAVETGDPVGRAKYGQRLLTGIAADGWCRLMPVEDGVYMPFRAFDPSRATAEDMEDLVTDDPRWDGETKAPVVRLPPRGRWLTRWRAQVAERAMGENGILWFVFEVQGLRTCPVYVAALGFDAVEPASDLRFRSAGTSCADMLSALRQKGFMTGKDYDARSIEVFSRLFGRRRKHPAR